MIEHAFNDMAGVTCSKIQGGMFAFPRIELPEKAIEAAQKQKIEPDMKYCLDLLNEKGVCLLPGMIFGQKPNTYHLRSNLVASLYLFEEMIDRIHTFHTKFMEEYKK